MKSQIDWNEIFPLLPKKLREDLMLEAVQLLSRKQAEPAVPNYRRWSDSGITGRLARAGRIYQINKKLNYPWKGEASKIKRLWNELLTYKTDTISYESLAKMAEAYELETQSTPSYLYSHGLIEVKE